MAKKGIYLRMALVCLFLASCGLLGGKIQPGDRIGDMEILDFCEGSILVELCSFDDLQVGNCQIPAEIKALWISPGWGEETQEELELSWKDSEWSMTIDKKTIDLPAFGTYDLDIPDPFLGVLKGRTWNVCIANPSPGEHIIRTEWNFVNGARRGNHAQDYIFTVLAEGN
jgi:hypothetical protein